MQKTLQELRDQYDYLARDDLLLEIQKLTVELQRKEKKMREVQVSLSTQLAKLVTEDIDNDFRP